MKQLLILLVVAHLICGEDVLERTGRNLSVFNVVSFPNSVCGATNGFNGTCYTASECTSLGGTASGTCASSFGVCCVFSIACGGSSSANNSYAIMSSYSISTDSDPCTYTFCRKDTDVCKLRIDFDTMVLAAPSGGTTTAPDSITIGDCNTDTLTVSNPGGPVPPTICGLNTGQHMFVPASTQVPTRVSITSPYLLCSAVQPNKHRYRHWNYSDHQAVADQSHSVPVWEPDGP